MIPYLNNVRICKKMEAYRAGKNPDFAKSALAPICSLDINGETVTSKSLMENHLNRHLNLLWQVDNMPRRDLIREQIEKFTPCFKITVEELSMYSGIGKNCRNIDAYGITKLGMHIFVVSLG